MKNQISSSVRTGSKKTNSDMLANNPRDIVSLILLILVAMGAPFLFILSPNIWGLVISIAILVAAITAASVLAIKNYKQKKEKFGKAYVAHTRKSILIVTIVHLFVYVSLQISFS